MRGSNHSNLRRGQEAAAFEQGESGAGTPYRLSDRELMVLKLLSEGLSDKEIALALGVTTYTVNKHVGAILIKMDARSRTAAAVRAIRERLFDHDATVGPRRNRRRSAWSPPV